MQIKDSKVGALKTNSFIDIKNEISEFLLENVTITDEIDDLAFCNLKAKRFIILDSTIHEIEEKAFMLKVSESFRIEDTNIERLQESAFANLNSSIDAKV